MKCKICGKEFKALGTHLRYVHKISIKDYYDKFLKNLVKVNVKFVAKKLNFLIYSMDMKEKLVVKNV